LIDILEAPGPSNAAGFLVFGPGVSAPLMHEKPLLPALTLLLPQQEKFAACVCCVDN
jgi:hypothetical protein